MTENRNAVAVQDKTGNKGKWYAGIAAASAAMVPAVSQAAFDTTALETDIAANSASMQTVMLAILTLVALFVGYKMIKRSMS